MLYKLALQLFHMQVQQQHFPKRHLWCHPRRDTTVLAESVLEPVCRERYWQDISQRTKQERYGSGTGDQARHHCYSGRHKWWTNTHYTGIRDNTHAATATSTTDTTDELWCNKAGPSATGCCSPTSSSLTIHVSSASYGTWSSRCRSFPAHWLWSWYQCSPSSLCTS